MTLSGPDTTGGLHDEGNFLLLALTDFSCISSPLRFPDVA